MSRQDSPGAILGRVWFDPSDLSPVNNKPPRESAGGFSLESSKTMKAGGVDSD